MRVCGASDVVQVCEGEVLQGLLTRQSAGLLSSSGFHSVKRRGTGAILEKPQIVTPPKWFWLLRRSRAKHPLIVSRNKIFIYGLELKLNTKQPYGETKAEQKLQAF